MFDTTRFGLGLFKESAGRAATLLRLLANEKRLMILCQLADGELAVGDIQSRVDLSQSALSQHLAPLVTDRSARLEIMRQVQIAAGMLILIGALLGAFVTPAWLGLSAFVGAGLLFAGPSGFCGMARLLMLAPSNRPRVA